MGKYKQGILGPFSGKVGSIVGSHWKDVNYIRSRPRPSKSDTEGQKKQRLKFKGVASLASSLMDTLVRPVWNLSAGNMTGYNLFVKTNLPAFNEEGELANFDALSASIGNLPPATDLTVKDDTEVSSGITITWSDESASGIGKASDKLHLLTIANGKAYVIPTSAIRSTESIDIELPLSPGKIHVYAFFGKEDASQFSSDKYHEITLT